ncbi:DUF47 domain-containing protein [Inconstantimicrobium mannanitabidum]|uniref:Uncharacterized protein n=1 Tax=Inconstantimicrobium mannanitabidum TaxID=1604901 RepID=A0ACB5R9V1_9CLOT|nr:DUF47 family protein [Clostridium sp. TW13]GKX65963.1 hypothetical protein rsdtw13_12210 [Clostridium sp. TW13]
MFNLKPKEDKFFIMFLEAAKNVDEAALTLRKSLDSLSTKEAEVSKIEELEHKGDKFVGKIVKELNEAFITPIDREDIYMLIKEMDDILDLINSTAHRFVMFNVNESTETAKLLGDMIVECTSNILGIMEELPSLGSKSNHLSERIISINRIENEADALFRQTVGELFRNETNPIEVIKWKEIYQILENTIDKCERIANMVEGVVIKNA